jgi:O-antigen ligase
MITSLKELIVVLAIATVIFRLGRPIALRFTDALDYSRRRNVWFTLTAAAFISPNFWWFALLAAPLLVWAGRKDKNPLALYLLLLQVIPSIPVTVPLPGFNLLFDVDNYRLLSLCIMVPAAWRLRNDKDSARIRGMTAMDAAILVYGVLQVALFVVPDLPNHAIIADSFTNQLRRALLFFVDVYVLYYVSSRSCVSRQLIAEAQAAFCLACVVMASVAIFETLRHWLLYTDISLRWGNDLSVAIYKFRGGSLRAQASSGNTLVLGYLLAIALGFWEYLQSHISGKFPRYAVAGLLLLGILATYSRGPLIGAIVIYVIVFSLRLRKMVRFLLVGVGALSVALLFSDVSLGDRITQLLPFSKGPAGEEASYSISYRQRLAARSWELIQAHPLFGDQMALQKMQDLRQGEGIIDLVNAYADVTVLYGVVGLGMFVGVMLIALARTIRTARMSARNDPDLALLGSSLIACILGTLVMMATCSFILGYEKLFYMIAGIAAAYANLGRSPRPGAAAHRVATVRRSSAEC